MLFNLFKGNNVWKQLVTKLLGTNIVINLLHLLLPNTFS